MNRRAIAWILVLVAVLLAGWAVSHRASEPDQDSAGATTSIPVATQPGDGWQEYSSDAYGFTARYPDGWSADDGYAYTALGPGKDIPGVSFTIPAAMAEGTNLSRDTHLSVEVLGSGTCAAASFLDQTVEHSTATENGRTWDVAKGGGAGAGNLYDETVYATQAGDRCYGLRLFIHSTNIGNYDPGTVTEFDRAALETAFAQFRASFATK